MNWQMNAAGDWELRLPDKRYRIEEWSGRFWLYEKPKELSAYSKLIGRHGSLEDAKSAINATNHCE